LLERTNDVPARGLIVLLCLMSAANTVSIGAFPALLPELGTVAGLADWQLGAVAGVFGFARMLANVPAGLFMTNHLARALVAAPVFVLAGALLMALGGTFAALMLGRALMGVGHTLSTLGSLTAILRHRAGPRLASSLSAMEFAAMLGVLSGAGLLALLPRAVPWHAAWLLACAPITAGLVVLPLLARALPRPDGDEARPLFARSEGAAAPVATPAPAAARHGALGLLAVVAGGAVAVSYSTVEQFTVPLRGSREFGLERAGIARLLMLSQAADLIALLPLGALADRRGTARVLGGVFLLFAVALALVGFAGLPLMTVGCAVFGVCMAGWMLPLGILRSATPPAQVAWRTALYRVAVDGGMFAGPFVAGLLSARHAGVLPGLMTVVMAAVGVALLAAARPSVRSR
jgi:MFS family permease